MSKFWYREDLGDVALAFQTSLAADDTRIESLVLPTGGGEGYGPGWIVQVIPPQERLIPVGLLTGGDVADYIEQHKELLARPDVALTGYVDGDDVCHLTCSPVEDGLRPGLVNLEFI